MTDARTTRLASQVAAVLVVGLALGSAWAQSAASTAEIVALLRGGGHVIVVRHGATHADQADTDPLSVDNVAKQRHLNDKGRDDARAMGEALRAAGVPIGKVYSSQFQRAADTARLIAGKDPLAVRDITEGGLVVSPNENNRRAQALRALVAAAPDPGTNTLIVTHKPNILDALGKDWFDIKEGEASIFRSDGRGSPVLVGRVQIGDWARSR